MSEVGTVGIVVGFACLEIGNFCTSIIRSRSTGIFARAARYGLSVEVKDRHLEVRSGSLAERKRRRRILRLL